MNIKLVNVPPDKRATALSLIDQHAGQHMQDKPEGRRHCVVWKGGAETWITYHGKREVVVENLPSQ